MLSPVFRMTVFRGTQVIINLIFNVLVRVSIAVTKRHEQKASLGEGVYLAYTVTYTVPHLRKSGQELKQGRNLEAGANAEAIKGFCL